MFNSEVNFKQVAMAPIIILIYFVVLYFCGEEEAICLFRGEDIWSLVSLTGICMSLAPWVCFAQNLKTTFVITYLGVMLVILGLGVHIIGWGWCLVVISVIALYMGIIITYTPIALCCIVGVLIFGIINRNVEKTPEKILPASEILYQNEPSVEWHFDIIDNHGVDIRTGYTFTGTREQLIAQMQKTLQESIRNNKNIGVVTYRLGEYGVCNVPRDIALKYGDIRWAKDQKYRHLK